VAEKGRPTKPFINKLEDAYDTPEKYALKCIERCLCEIRFNPEPVFETQKCGKE
jgi:hypothetical protein